MVIPGWEWVQAEEEGQGRGAGAEDGAGDNRLPRGEVWGWVVRPWRADWDGSLCVSPPA